jgi:hypothetical protein
MGLLRCAARMLGDLFTWSWMAARERSGGIGDGWWPDSDVGTDDVGGHGCDVGGMDAGEPGILMGIGNRGCWISGPAAFGVRGGVGGWPPPDGELELPSKAEDKSPAGKDPSGPKPLPELGESVSDDEAGGDESFSGTEMFFFLLETRPPSFVCRY